MDLTQLKRFVTTVESGSLGKAAEHLSLSQPGLSKSVQEFEGSFGAQLLKRSAKGVTLTALGEIVYSRGKRILAEWRKLESDRVTLMTGLVGRVTIGVARGTGLLSRVLPEASAKLSHPRYSIELQLISGVTRELAHTLRVGDLDFAVVVLDGLFATPDLTAEVLFHDRCALFVDANHPLTRSERVDMEELVKFCWLYSSDVASLYEAMTELAQRKGLEPRRTVVDSNSVACLRSMLMGSEFVGMLSMDSVEDSVIAGQLVEIVLDPGDREHLATVALERPIGFLRRTDAPLSPVAVAIQNEIYGLCQRLGYPLLPRAGVDRS